LNFRRVLAARLADFHNRWRIGHLTNKQALKRIRSALLGVENMSMVAPGCFSWPLALAMPPSCGI